MSRSIALEVAEEFCDAQEPTRRLLQSQSWRSHGGHAVDDELSDEELLASAWAELPGERRWTPVVWSAKTGRWSVGTGHRETTSRLLLDEPKMVAQYNNGWSLKRVAAEHGCSDMTARAVLHRHDVQCRSLSEAQRESGVFSRDNVYLDDETVTDLRIRRWLHDETWEALAVRYGISYTAARSAGVGLSWSHVPMPEACLEGMRRRAERLAAARVAEAVRVEHEPKVFDIELAKRLYVVERKSLKRAAKAMGCSDKTLKNELSVAGVRIRDKSEAADAVWASDGVRRLGAEVRNA